MAETSKKAAAAKKSLAKKGAAKKPAAKAAADKAATKKTVTKRSAAKKASAASGSAAPSDLALGVLESKFFKSAVDRAKAVASDPQKLRDLANSAGRSTALRSGSFAGVLDDVQALIRLVVAYARGTYRQIPLDHLVVIVAGLIYVVSPIDLIPDAVLGVGFLDDAALVGWLIKRVRDELDQFRAWEAGMVD